MLGKSPTPAAPEAMRAAAQAQLARSTLVLLCATGMQAGAAARALDARLDGDSYRTIAEVLLGFRGTKEDFENDPRKNKARRLVARSGGGSRRVEAQQAPPRRSSRSRK